MITTTYKETKQGFYWPAADDVTVFGNVAPSVRREITVTIGRREGLMLGLRFIANALRHRRWSFFVSHEDPITR
jgi:hypothetical protein